MHKITKDDYHCIPYSLMEWICVRMDELYKARITPEMSPYRHMIILMESYLQTQRERMEFELTLTEKEIKNFFGSE